MSSPTRDTGKQYGHLAYAPKWARDSDYRVSSEIARAEFSQHSGAQDLGDDQLLAPDLIDTNKPQGPEHARLAPPSLTGAEQHEVGEQPLSERELFQLHRSLETDFVEQARSATVASRQRAILVALTIVMASIGAAILLFVTDKVTDEWKTMPGLKTAFTSWLASDSLNDSEKL